MCNILKELMYESALLKQYKVQTEWGQDERDCLKVPSKLSCQSDIRGIIA